MSCVLVVDICVLLIDTGLNEYEVSVTCVSLSHASIRSSGLSRPRTQGEHKKMTLNCQTRPKIMPKNIFHLLDDKPTPYSLELKNEKYFCC